MKNLFSLLLLAIIFLTAMTTRGAYASDDLGEALFKGKPDINIRSYYMKRSYDISDSKESLAVGGSLGYQTLWWKNLRAGATMFTSQGFIFNDEDKNGTGLLGSPRQTGYTVLGHAYLQGKISKTEFTIFRQELDTPFINPYDFRMTPFTFEAYTIKSKDISKFTFLASHVTKIKKWTDTTFESMSGAAGIYGANEPVTMAGVIYEPAKDYKLQLWNYYCYNFMNIAYFRADGEWKLNNETTFSASTQFINQQDIGKSLAGEFNTTMAGVQGILKWKGFGFRFAYTATDSNHGIMNPWSSYPGFTSIIVEDNDRAGENTWLTGLSYDFSSIGINGLSILSNYTDSCTPKTGANASPSQRELDFTVDYRFNKLLKGLWLRFRAGFVNQDKSMDGQDMKDIRVIVNYKVPF
jgi:hypothetical protein